jgi:hypothetical protein
VIGAAKNMQSKIILKVIPNTINPHTKVSRLHHSPHIRRNDKVIPTSLLLQRKMNAGESAPVSVPIHGDELWREERMRSAEKLAMRKRSEGSGEKPQHCLEREDEDERVFSTSVREE